MADRFQDKRILDIATEVAKVPDTVVPRILLQLQDVLDSYPAGSVKLTQAKQCIWQYELPPIVVTTLKQDFNKILDGWNMAKGLCDVLSRCCIGFKASDEAQFKEVFLPSVMECLLMFARRVQMKYIKTLQVLEDAREKYLKVYTSVMDAICLLFGGHIFLTEQVVKSPWLLQMLLTDDEQPIVVCLRLLQNANRTIKSIMGELSEKVLHQIMDELIYKLTATPHMEVARATTRTVLVISESHPPMVELLCVRYRGLRQLLSKWVGTGFDRDLRQLQLLLDSGNKQQADLKRLHQAASVIQALWRSHSTRKRLGNADRAIAKFQHSFRIKRKRQEEEGAKTRMESELQRFLLVRRKRTMRELYQQELDTLHMIPAADIQKHLTKKEVDAAVRIQTWYRGYKTRRTMKDKKRVVKDIRAAIVIQRAVRKFLTRLSIKRGEPPAWQRPPGLTDARRVQLQEDIMQWRQQHQVQATTAEAASELHERVQGMLRQVAIKSKATRRKQMHREALLGQLELDTSLLLDAPGLDEVTNSDLETFVSHSVPIATKARQNHNEQMRLLRQPWWRKLGDEFENPENQEDVDWKIF